MADELEESKAPAMERDALEARVGSVLCDKWTLERLIGAGATAAVYAARHEIGRREAIKILHPDVAQSDELVGRFRREARAANRFDHPGAVEVRDVDTTEDGLPFMVMELLEGENLSQRMRREPPLGLDRVLAMAEELLDVLAAAHAHGVIHRDIKPSNLFLQTDGRLRVLDFGIARVMQGASGTLLTEAGTTLGTVAYMPPEQLRGSDVDGRADLFAVGATMYRLLSGHPVHESDSEAELARRMLAEPAPPLSETASEVPEAVCLVVDRALAHHQDRRYPSAEAMQKDVRALMAGEDPPYAAARLKAGDDPRSKSAPNGQPDGDHNVRDVHDDREEDESGGEEDESGSEAATDAEGGTVTMTALGDDEAGPSSDDAFSDDEAPTVKREAASDAPPTSEAPTRKRPAKTEVGEAAAIAARVDAAYVEPRKAQPAPSPWKWVAVMAVVGVIAYFWVRRGASDETEPPPFDSDVSTAEEQEPDTVLEPDAEDDAESAEGGGTAAEPDQSSAAGSAAPRPSSTRPTPSVPSGWPTALPTSFPTAIPTSLPTSLPSSFPRPPQPSASAAEPKPPPASPPPPPPLDDPYE
jgi:serine/threonine-protein kinase